MPGIVIVSVALIVTLQVMYDGPREAHLKAALESSSNTRTPDPNSREALHTLHDFRGPTAMQQKITCDTYHAYSCHSYDPFSQQMIALRRQPNMLRTRRRWRGQ